MANEITGRMRSLGVSLDESELRDLRILAAGDRRSISWLLRDAVQDYLSKRKDDVRSYTAKRVMEQLEEQSKQQRAQRKDELLNQEVTRMAAAAGMNLDPEKIKAIIAATVKKLTAAADVESGEQSPDSSEAGAAPKKDRKS